MEYSGFAMAVIFPVKTDCNIEREKIVSLSERLHFKNDWWSETGEAFFVKEDSCQVRGYQIKKDGQTLGKLGMYQDYGTVYHFVKQPYIKFVIDNIKIWIGKKHGIMVEVDILVNRQNLKSSDIFIMYDYFVYKARRTGEVGIIAEHHNEIQFTLKKLVQRIMENILDSNNMKFEVCYRDIYSLMDCVMDERNENIDLKGEIRLFQGIQKDSPEDQLLGQPQSQYYFKVNNHGVHWFGTEKNLVLFVENNNSFAKLSPYPGGLYKSVFSYYMAIYAYQILNYISVNIEDKMQCFKLLERLDKNFAGVRQEHVNKIFLIPRYYIWKKLRLESAREAAVPLRNSVEVDPNCQYVFISYSHKDYMKVYPELVKLYEKGINYWYDTGLKKEAGTPWEEVVHKKISDENCVGVIFYMSSSSFLSKSISKEVAVFSGKTELCGRKNYFAINLQEDADNPGKILKKAIEAADTNLVSDSDFMKNISIIADAFPNNVTVLNYLDGDHVEHICEKLSKAPYAI